MSATITLPDNLYQRLAVKSQQLQRSPEMLLADLVQHFLDDTESRWRAEFVEALLAHVQARTRIYSPAKIETDITLAANEAKEAHRARRSG